MQNPFSPSFGLVPPIYLELSGVDRQFVRAMAEVGEDNVAIAATRQRMKKPSNLVANYRRHLIDDQVITPADYGHVSFTLPLFGDFVRQNQELLELM